jgi:hypothetical protein
MHALLVAHMFREQPSGKRFTVADLVQRSLVRLKEKEIDFAAIAAAGWDVDTSSLLTRTDNRISIVQSTKKEQ